MRCDDTAAWRVGLIEATLALAAWLSLLVTHLFFGAYYAKRRRQSRVRNPRLTWLCGLFVSTIPLERLLRLIQAVLSLSFRHTIWSRVLWYLCDVVFAVGTLLLFFVQTLRLRVCFQNSTHAISDSEMGRIIGLFLISFLGGCIWASGNSAGWEKQKPFGRALMSVLSAMVLITAVSALSLIEWTFVSRLRRIICDSQITSPRLSASNLPVPAMNTPVPMTLSIPGHVHSPMQRNSGSITVIGLPSEPNSDGSNVFFDSSLETGPHLGSIGSLGSLSSVMQFPDTNQSNARMISLRQSSVDRRRNSQSSTTMSVNGRNGGGSERFNGSQRRLIRLAAKSTLLSLWILLGMVVLFVGLFLTTIEDCDHIAVILGHMVTSSAMIVIGLAVYLNVRLTNEHYRVLCGRMHSAVQQLIINETTRTVTLARLNSTSDRG